MGLCPYHGKYKATASNDYQCPKCEHELVDYGLFASGKSKKPKKAMDLLRMTKL